MKTISTCMALSSLVIAVSLAFSSPEPQSTAGSVGTQRGGHLHEVTLSEEDGAVFHISFFAGPAAASVEGGDSGSGINRAVSFACYVLVEEQWEPSIIHGFDCVDVLGTAEVLLGAGYGSKYFRIEVSPLPGRMWGTVQGTEDLQFVVNP